MITEIQDHEETEIDEQVPVKRHPSHFAIHFGLLVVLVLSASIFARTMMLYISSMR